MATQNFGDRAVPLDGNENNKTEISLIVDKYFSGIISISDQKRNIGCRVVPNDGFVNQFGGNAASYLEMYLTDVRKNQKPTYVALLAMGNYPANLKDHDIHLGWFYSLPALTDPEKLQEFLDEYNVPKQIFSGLAAKTLYVTLNFITKLSPILWSTDKIIGLDADGAIPGAVVDQDGENDRSLLAKYYMKLGFNVIVPEEKEKLDQGIPIFKEIRMKGKLEDILGSLKKIVG